MPNAERSPNEQMTKHPTESAHRHSDSVIPSRVVIGHSSSSSGLIAAGAQLTELLRKIEAVDRVAIDTEADSLHCYREKLCLLQVSLPGWDCVVDPLADLDPAPLRAVLAEKEIVIHGADYDLRLLRRNLNFVPRKIFDTVIAARLIGIREFSLAALVQRYFGVELAKGSQKANWAQRPLPARMLEYAMNDVHYLLPLADRLDAELQDKNRVGWFRQSCERAIDLAALDRRRDVDEAWRVRGSGALRGVAAAVLRELWQWRENEAQVADRPPFHILQNHELVNAAESFASGGTPDFRHFSSRRRNAFRAAGQSALELPQEKWPLARRRSGTRRSAEMNRRTEELRRRRDRAANEFDLEPGFLAPRAALETIAADQDRAASLLVPWQREALGL
jgi:ribonuclease D